MATVHNLEEIPPDDPAAQAPVDKTKLDLGYLALVLLSEGVDREQIEAELMQPAHVVREAVQVYLDRVLGSLPIVARAGCAMRADLFCITHNRRHQPAEVTS
ncbi:hypothetical protein [Paractinoplanes atraurantiacus]|uniref:Uncharacterized protein n=1 Tax=Paractinoplanes atraurantiacus TaxID=1036182 RepID=A0A285GZZ4_9ACTN|nr:hypothetical protein [Actinoplanes atraurantiacus]SNY28883.1 hypothetical protein SAMN05421748_103150 [Actinoplanes atraurantiacus]